MVATALAASIVVGTATASADSTSEYGEVTRFGGFDSSAFNGERYGGPLTPGKFLDPTGFAVDPQDNTVYVVDRTSFYAENPTSWRIQQFSPTGEVLGTTTFTLPNSNFGASAVTGLAVDHRAGRLYALVIGSPPSSAPIKGWPIAQELLAWSTTATGSETATGRELRAPQGLPADPLHTTGGLVSSAAQLRSGPTFLYSPQGIAIDRLETPDVDDPVAIEATDYLPGAGLGNPIPGDTIVQQVASDGNNPGQLLTRWSGASLAEKLHGSWGPVGISTNPDGTLTVLLDSQRLSAADAYVVRLKADLSEPTVLNEDEKEPESNDFDQAPLWIDDSPFAPFAGVVVSDPNGAGAEVVQLSTTASSDVNGRFAADIFSAQAQEVGLLDDHQFSPTAPGPEYWVSGGYEAHYLSNIGVRLLQPAADGAISTPEGDTIANTLGNVKVGAQCNIGAPEAVLAAGAEGILWVLDRGPKADAPKASGQGRQIIELAPGSGHLCPQPSGTFTMTPDGGSNKSGGETLTIPAGTQVTFNAESIKLQGGKPFTYEWDLDGNAADGPGHDGFETILKMVPPEYYWPSSNVVHTYNQPGRYTIRARLRSDYGVYTMSPATIVVTGPAHPEAKFTVAVTPGSQQVAFNAAGSSPGVGSIANYHWSWGDGTSEDEASGEPIVTHTYSQPGVYRVALTVINSSYQSATSALQTVTVTPPTSRPAAAETPSVLGPLYDIPQPLYPVVPASPQGRTTSRLFAHAHFAGRALSVTLSCPAATRSCAGTVRAETAAVLADVSGHRKKSKHRRLLLGHASFRVSGGRQATVAIRLSAKGDALLRKLKHLPVLIVVSAHDSLGTLTSRVLRLTLNVAASRGSHRYRSRERLSKDLTLSLTSRCCRR